MKDAASDDGRYTQWMNPGEKVRAGKRGEILSCYGDVTGIQWCEKEIERIEAKGGKAVIITNESGMIAVSRT